MLSSARHVFFVMLVLAVVLVVSIPATAQPDEERIYDLLCTATVRPADGIIDVSLVLGDGARNIIWLEFAFDRTRFRDFVGDGTVEETEGGIRWTPPPQGGSLNYKFQITQMKDARLQTYDAYCTESWAIFRADHMIPSPRFRRVVGAKSRTTFTLNLPVGWQAAVPYPSNENGAYVIDRPEYSFDRPVGWMMAGRLNILRRDVLGMKVAIASPANQEYPAATYMDAIERAAPYLREVVEKLPAHLVIVGADDPMWRGGLSGPDSLYLHAQRPLIDWDGTSPLFHEIFHVATNARSGHDGDWATEGMAEYYSLKMLHKAGLISADQLQEFMNIQLERGQRIRNLRVANSTTDTTRRAVIALHRLDLKIQTATLGAKNLDHVVRLVRDETTPLTTGIFQNFAERVAGVELEDFFAVEVPGAGGEGGGGAEAEAE